MLKLTTISVGALGVNCHIVWNPESRQALVFDAGAEFERIRAQIESLQLAPVAAFLTHAHVDHIGAVPELCTTYNIPVWIHQEDREMYSSPANALLPWLPHVENLPIPSETVPAVDGFNFQILHTPGHSRGGCCYYFPEEGFVLTGDTLFASGVGRTDLPGGNERVLMKSIREQLFTLPGKTFAHPGHGASTTIGTEKQDPYLNL